MATSKFSTDTEIEIGSRLELFVDDFLVSELRGGAKRTMHRPTAQEVVLVTDEPWEGNACGYFTVFQDGSRFRMYYRGWHFEMKDDSLIEPHAAVVCYAESEDGIHWVKPDLGLVEFQGSTHNNIILDTSDERCPAFNFAPFLDTNPQAEATARYKAWAVKHGIYGLYPLQSADGIHWTAMADTPVITKGYFDSQNLAFWDSERGEYRDYHRDFRQGRDIMTSTSTDFLQWTEPEYLAYRPSRISELYTNQVIPYPRAPDIFLGFPTRYVERPWSAATDDLPELEERRRRSAVHERYGAALTDGMFMSSRDGATFNLWPESFIRPGLRPQDNWTYGDNYQNWGLITTLSSYTGAPDELSFYVTEGYWRGESVNLRRYTMRLDGFVSVQAPLSGGELVTRPIRFDGRELLLNFSASAAGSVRVELLHPHVDVALEGFSSDNCIELLGDDVARRVHWANGADVGQLAGTPLRLRFVLQDADLYSFQFAG